MLQSLFNKVVGLKACNFIKNRIQHGRFPVKFAHYFPDKSSCNIFAYYLLSQGNAQVSLHLIKFPSIKTL